MFISLWRSQSIDDVLWDTIQLTDAARDPVHMMSVEQQWMAADLWTKPISFSHSSAYRQPSCLHSLLLLKYKADTHLLSQGIEGWVDPMAGYAQRGLTW